MLVKFTQTHLWNCKRFEPRSHFNSRLSLIVRVNVVLNRTVAVVTDWRFDNLCGSHLQSQSQSLFDSEDDYCTGCRNVSHWQQQQSYSGLCSLERLNLTYFWHLWKLMHKLRKSVHGLSTIWKGILTYKRLHCKKLSNQKSTLGGQLHTNDCISSTQASHWCLFSHYKLDSQTGLHTGAITDQIALGPAVIINLISWTEQVISISLLPI